MQPCYLGSVEMKENKSRSAVSDGDKAYSGTGEVPTRKPWEDQRTSNLRWVLKTVTVCEGVSNMKGGTGKTQEHRGVTFQASPWDGGHANSEREMGPSSCLNSDFILKALGIHVRIFN